MVEKINIRHFPDVFFNPKAHLKFTHRWDTHISLLWRTKGSNDSCCSTSKPERTPLMTISWALSVVSATVAFFFLKQWAVASSQGWILAILFLYVCCYSPQVLNRSVRLQLCIYMGEILTITSGNRKKKALIRMKFGLPVAKNVHVVN